MINNNIGGYISMKTFLIIFTILAAIICFCIYVVVSRYNFNEKLKSLLPRKGFSTSYRVISLNNTNLRIVKDNKMKKFGIINEKSSNFITNIYDDFEITDYLNDETKFLAIDEKTRRTCIVRQNSQGNPDIKFYESNDIVSVEINEVTDSETRTITKTNRGSQVVGAAVGTALLGGAGLILGGLTGSKSSKAKTTTKVKKIELKLTLNDLHTPVITFALFEGEIKLNSDVYQKIMKSADYWDGIFRVLIHYK